MQTTINHADGTSTPVWIVKATEGDCAEWNTAEDLHESYGDTVYTPGYYWAVCSPGCIPDSEFFGPFTNEESAIEGAKEQLNYW
jgi:hypothetical protein